MASLKDTKLNWKSLLSIVAIVLRTAGVCLRMPAIPPTVSAKPTLSSFQR